jgi:hypothetical protein
VQLNNDLIYHIKGLYDINMSKQYLNYEGEDAFEDLQCIWQLGFFHVDIVEAR